MAPRKRIQIEEQRDFTGGLNLKDDPYNLGDNETFDLQNVDIDRRGGFGIRRGSERFIDKTTVRAVTATGAVRAANVVTVSGLSPVNGDPDGLKPGMIVTADFPLGGGGTNFDGTFTVVTAVNGASTATWAQTAANDSTGAGTVTELFGAASGTPDSGYTYVDTSSVRHILIARAGHVKRWDGSAWQEVITLNGNGRTQFMEFNNVLYILRPGAGVPYTWTGSGLATQLTTAVGNYNDDLAAPNQGNYPQTNTFAHHVEVAWAGGVQESSFQACRLRWSHPGQPQDWRTNDFIDVDPDDENGIIRALIPWGDRLIVFKDKAVYAVHGYPPSGFSVQNLTKEIGTPSPYSVVATEQYIYFWDVDTGAWRYDGKSFEWIFEPIYRFIDDGKINVAFSFQVIAEFHRDRLWLSVPYLAPPYQSAFVSFVYQPSSGKHGAWTLHTRTLFGWWVHRGSDGGDEHLVGGNGTYLYELDVEELFEDQSEAAMGAYVPIVAWYTTRWFDNDNTAVKKRWKRPVVVMRGGSEQVTVVDVLTDYDPTHVTKTFELTTELDGTTGIWDDPGSDWDVADWAPETTLGGEKSLILRGSPLGNGVAKALRFKNTTQGQDWRIHGLTMKWIDKHLRN